MADRKWSVQVVRSLHVDGLKGPEPSLFGFMSTWSDLCHFLSSREKTQKLCEDFMKLLQVASSLLQQQAVIYLQVSKTISLVQQNPAESSTSSSLWFNVVLLLWTQLLKYVVYCVKKTTWNFPLTWSSTRWPLHSYVGQHYLKVHKFTTSLQKVQHPVNNLPCVHKQDCSLKLKASQSTNERTFEVTAWRSAGMRRDTKLADTLFWIKVKAEWNRINCIS